MTCSKRSPAGNEPRTPQPRGYQGAASFIYFTEDFFELLFIVPSYGSAIILGDFNIHILCPKNAIVLDVMNELKPFNLTLYITGSTRIGKSNTLDLVRVV